ncbi:MAG: hypothetical protein B6D41_09875 [Chloroflexi bacterium UTCFX4]|nr:MAG: hypothetical protein B6D41_09875 [Chloroflexi bacterium UTCFX4]
MARARRGARGGAAMIPQHVFDAWRADLDAREPRALELAYALELTLPRENEANARWGELAQAENAAALVSEDARALMQFAYERYDAFRVGNFTPVELGNPNIFAFERACAGERLLVVNNLARVLQPAKLTVYADRAGWDILNRVEFVFPPRAQLDAYEFLWLLLTDEDETQAATRLP